MSIIVRNVFAIFVTALILKKKGWGGEPFRINSR